MFAKIHARTTRKKQKQATGGQQPRLQQTPVCWLYFNAQIYHLSCMQILLFCSFWLKMQKKFNISWCVNTFAKHRKKQLLEMFWLLN